MGTETEYGIWSPDAPGVDVEHLAALVIDAVDGPATPPYADTHNRVLGNGARFYVDHGHPEYATPEATHVDDAALHDAAGDVIVARAAAAASRVAGFAIEVYKNNTDGHGHSYGHHENYLLARRLCWDDIEAQLPTFLVTRTIFAGAGRVGLGDRGQQRGFQLSQRADFFERVVGLDTTRNRGILNTRDEPHATASLWRRLHVIPGDANRNPFATWLRLGSTALVCASIEAGVRCGVRLADPVGAFGQVSRDVSLGRPIALEGGGSATALEIQRRFLDAVAAGPARADFPGADEILGEWASVLDDLQRDPASTRDRLDWTAKLGLLDALRVRDGLAWDAPRLAQLDLAWAKLGPDSPYELLKRAGRLCSWLDPDEVERAAVEPPTDTRAYARGRLVCDHPDALIAATWDSALVKDASGGLHPLRMSEPTQWGEGDYERRIAALPPLARLRARE